MMRPVRVVATIETHGERIATTGERWALAYGDWVRLYDGAEPAGELPPAPEHVYDLRYGGDVLLAAPSRAAGDVWEDLPPLGRAIDPWRVVTATWTGEQLLVVQCAPSGGHEQHVRLYDGSTRAPGDVLWADSEWMRVEVVAAGAGRLAAAALEVRVWDASGRDLFVVEERGVQVRRVLLAAEDVIVGYADGHVAVRALGLEGPRRRGARAGAASGRGAVRHRRLGRPRGAVDARRRAAGGDAGGGRGGRRRVPRR